jgi:glycosyltransferase involved in cell wall biosynthesis
LAWTAFYKAFDFQNRDVRLIIKARPGSLPFMDFSYSSDPRLTLWRADVEQVGDIYSQFDAYVFPSRAEGLGMPPREAAACGVPVLATRYSGLADDIDHWATPLEQFTLTESHMQGCGGKWAEPDLDELIWRMRDMYEHQDDYRAKGLQAAQWLRENRTYMHVANHLSGVVARWLGGPIEEQVKYNPAMALPIKTCPTGFEKALAVA